MSLFSEVKPQWDNVGVEPSGAKKTAGWLLNEKPPAEWFNWLFNRNYKCIDELRTVVDALAVSSGAANTIVYGASATGNDSYVIAPNPAIIAYGAGMVVEMYVDVGNTAGATINVSAKGVKTIKKITNAGKVALDTGDMVATGIYTLVYDGTDFILANPTAIPASIITGAGDLIYGSAANTPARLAKGTDGQILGLSGGVPAWENKITLAGGSFSDQSTVWLQAQTKALTIPLGANVKQVRLAIGNGNISYMRYLACDVSSHKDIMYSTVSSGYGVTQQGQGYFSFTSTPTDAWGIYFQSARISGTNLILTFECGNQSNKTMQISGYWEGIY